MQTVPSSALALLLAAACAPEPTERVVVTEMAIQARSADPDAPLRTQDANGASFTVQEAWLSVRHIELDVPEDADWDCAAHAETLEAPVRCESDKLVVDGPFVIDLVTGQSTPDLSAITLVAGTYDRIDVRVDDAEPDDGLVGEGDPLAEHSLYAAGTLDVDGDPVELELALQFNEDVRFSAPGGIAVDADGGALIARLDLDAWLASAPLATCVAEGELEVEDGEPVRIDDDTRGRGDCSDIEDEIKEAMKDGLDLVHDEAADEDAAHDDDETEHEDD